MSRDRLLNDTRWSEDWLTGKIILDAGCGAGRFSDELAQLGATVIACDISRAVDACKLTVETPDGQSGIRSEVHIIQADLASLPLKPGIFDGIHCAGVIQHTADPPEIMRRLPPLAKPGGQVFYNFYEIDPSSRFQVIKYLLRRWTPDWRPGTLYRFAMALCILLFLPSWIMSRIPVIRYFNRFLPICSVHPAGVTFARQFRMTLLDTIDWYGPRYEIRQDHHQVAQLLRDAGLQDVRSESGLAWAAKP